MNSSSIQKYDPDKLDYYRIDLSRMPVNDTKEENSGEFAIK